MMVGDSVSDVDRHLSSKSEDATVLALNNLNLPASSPFSVTLKAINLTLREGEVLGIAGVAGNGQKELFDAVAGESLVAPPDAISIRGRPVGNLDINKRRRMGAAYVPEERLGHGAVGEMALSDNMLLARHASDKAVFQWGKGLGLVWKDMVKKATDRVVAAMDVRKSGDDPAANALSGGNLQKFITGRELDRQPALLVLNQPTWGVDAGATVRIRQALIDLARTGSGLLVISQDLDEILEISDRIAVLFDGRLSGAVAVSETSREALGLLMAGAGDFAHSASDAEKMDAA